MNTIIAYCDGGFISYKKGTKRENEKYAYGSFYIQTTNTTLLKRLTYDDVFTNNEAEYRTLIELLKELNKTYKTENVLIYSDSLLMVNQVNGVWSINSENLVPFIKEVFNLFDFNRYKLVWTSRKTIQKILNH